MSNLEDLPEGLLAEIARLVSSYDDFEAIHEVNHHWRSSLRGLCYSCTTPQAPWLMLAAEDDTKDGEVEERGFYSLTNSRMRRVKLPERLRRRRCLSSRGWLLTVSRYLSLSLVNPFSKHVIHLPHPPDKNPKYEDEWRFYVEKFALSSSPLKDEKDYTVMIIYGDRSDLAFWRPVDSTWTKIGFQFASDVIYAGGVFFFTDFLFQVGICGITGMQPAVWDVALGKRSYTTKFRVLADMNASLKHCSSKIYVVHSQRNLLVVNRTIDKVHHTTKVTVAHLAIRRLLLSRIWGIGRYFWVVMS